MYSVSVTMYSVSVTMYLVSVTMYLVSVTMYLVSVTMYSVSVTMYSFFRNRSLFSSIAFIVLQFACVVFKTYALRLAMYGE